MMFLTETLPLNTSNASFVHNVGNQSSYSFSKKNVEYIFQTSESFQKLDNITLVKRAETKILNNNLGKKEIISIDAVRANIFENLIFPIDWENEGISKPNLASKSKTLEICKEIFNKHQIYPKKIAPTKEEGIYFYYENNNKNKSLIIEVYNNLEIAAIVTDNESRTIGYSEDIYGLHFTEVFKVFNS